MTHLSDPLTPARLSEIRARAEAATLGPWHVYRDGILAGVEDGGEGGIAEPPLKWTDASFIAAARQDVPDLLDEVDRLTAALNVAEKYLRTKAEHDQSCPYWNEGWVSVQFRPEQCTCWKADYAAAKEALNHE